MDREKVIKGLEILRDICNAKSNMAIGNGKVAWAGYENTVIDAIDLLKEQDKRYAMMVVDWLRDMAHNNYIDSSHMTFLDAILDIRERAQTGIENYFRDYGSDTKRQEGR